MRILVTGATGFVGQNLVPHLLDAGHTVIVLVRERYGMGDPLPPRLATLRHRFQPVYADLRNFQLTVRAVRQARPDAILHLAAAGVTDPYLPLEAALRHNLNGSLNVIRAGFEKTDTCRQLIVARTPGEKAPTNVYSASKAAAWQFCTMYTHMEGWPIHGAMIFQAYGPAQPENALIPAAFRAALAGEDFPMTSGTQQRDWIYVDDVVRGLTALLDAPLEAGATVELGTGKATTVLDVVRQIYSMVGGGGRPRPGNLPDRPGEPSRLVAENGLVRTVLGWQPTHSLKDGLERLLQTSFQ